MHRRLGMMIRMCNVQGEDAEILTIAETDGDERAAECANQDEIVLSTARYLSLGFR